MAGREKNCKWYFADQPNVQEVGPNNAMEQNFKHHPYASLVRESIQNSLDAVLDKSEPVRMEFSFKEMRGNEYPQFFELKNHIQGCIDYYPNNRNAKAIYEPMLKLFDDNLYAEHLGYVRISDFNTKGMAYKEGKTDSPFYTFVRSAGVSAKDDTTAGGSFGFGKAAYYLLSPISTIIVSTCTDKFEKYFEGATSLCTHLYEGCKKVAFGYYDDRNGKPICDETDIPARFRRSEPGTDINILGFNLKYTDEAVKEMTEAVLRNFWMAILNGKLVVDINGTVHIDKHTIADLMEETFEELDDNTRKAGYYNPRPYFDAVRLANTSKKYLLYETALSLLGHVCFFVSKSKRATDKISYLRANQMLIYSKRTKTNYGMYGVFFCDSDKGNEILVNLENPAHDEWKPNNWREGTRVNGKGRVAMQEMDDFINKSLNKTFALNEKLAVNIKGLEDFLYIPTSQEEDEDIETDNGMDSVQGKPTGKIQEDGTSYTTDIPKEDDNPGISPRKDSSSTGHVMINTTTPASDGEGRLRSGNGSGERKPNSPGIKKPGDATASHTPDQGGEKGIFATPINVPYRTFSQKEDGKIYHYVVLHPENEVDNARLRFFAVGEESDEELSVAESSMGNVSGNIIRDLHMNKGSMRIRIRFSDSMKHSLKMTAEELNEI